MEEPEEEEEPEQEEGQSTESESASSATEAVFQFLEYKKIPHDQLISLGGSPAHHYTDLNGLRGIVENDDLWLTNAQYSNDEEELEHGYQVAQTVVKEEKEKSATPEGRLYIDHLEKLVEASHSQCYVCCFCQKRDLLSQWRGYAAYGTGVDLEIDIVGFASQLKCSYGPLYYWKVFYEDTDKKQRVKDAINHFRPAGRESPAASAKRARQAAASINFFIPTFKHERFSEESEWRLIFVPSPSIRPADRPKLQFRVSRNLLVPYYQLNELIPASPEPIVRPQLRIVKVTVGPSRHKELIAESVRMLLSQYGHTASVDVSKTPYRG